MNFRVKKPFSFAISKTTVRYMKIDDIICITDKRIILGLAGDGYISLCKEKFDYENKMIKNNENKKGKSKGLKNDSKR